MDCRKRGAHLLMKYLILVLALACVGCSKNASTSHISEFVAYSNEIPDERRTEAAQWMIDALEAADTSDDGDVEDTVNAIYNAMGNIFSSPLVREPTY